MDSKLLGQRIKEARLAKKMTQSEVVGSFITRNMLSQIESGNAVPSMKTLTYLAKVLELPPSVLLQGMTEEDTEAAAEHIPITVTPPEAATFYNAKKAYLTGDDHAAYEALSSISKDSPLADEACALSARILLRMAADACKKKNFAEALELAKTAEANASKGIYASMEIKSRALLLLSEAAASLAKENQ